MCAYIYLIKISYFLKEILNLFNLILSPLFRIMSNQIGICSLFSLKYFHKSNYITNVTLLNE